MLNKLKGDVCANLGTVTEGNWVNADLQTAPNAFARYELNNNGFSGHTSTQEVFSITRSPGGGMRITLGSDTYDFDPTGVSFDELNVSDLAASLAEIGTLSVANVDDAGAGEVRMQSTLAAQHVLPRSGDTYNIGGAGNTFAQGHFSNLFGSSLECVSFIHTGANLGFYGSAGPGGQQVVTGSRGGNAALESLLDALSALNLIQDSSS